MPTVSVWLTIANGNYYGQEWAASPGDRGAIWGPVPQAANAPDTWTFQYYRRRLQIHLHLRHTLQTQVWLNPILGEKRQLKAGGHTILTSRELMWLRVHLGYFNIEFWRRLKLLSLGLRHVIWHGALVGLRARTPLKFLLSYTFRETWRTCRVLFNIVTSCFQKSRKCLLKIAPTDLFIWHKSADYRDQHMRANAWEEIGRELKIKRKTWRDDSVYPDLVSE
jgi:hypothetical protein